MFHELMLYPQSGFTVNETGIFGQKIYYPWLKFEFFPYLCRPKK
jgi:hypothetical protein